MKPQPTLRILITGLGLGALGACSSEHAAHDPVQTAFYREAGSLIDTGTFGNATMNNQHVMKQRERYVYDLSQRFSSEVMTTVNFAFNSWTLDHGAKDTLKEQAHWIHQFPEVHFKVYGHADKVGNAAYNKSLGHKRAHAVVDYLVSQGISRHRLEAVVSFGETQPLIVTEGKERRNRRTVTEVAGFLHDTGPMLDAEYARVVYRGYVRSAESGNGLSGISVQSAGGGG